MNISENGKKLIKKYEGCRLTAYKAVSTEQYWTIGWGHYGPDVKQGSKISQTAADAMFDDDIVKYVNYVKALKMDLNQNQFDALVSFAYNCGQGNLNRLCSDRNVKSISKWITAYNKSGGNVLKGLTIRRAEEKALFDKASTKVVKVSTPKKTTVTKTTVAKVTKYKVTADLLNIRKSSNATSKILGTLKKNETVQVVSISNGWAKIKSNDTHVYVSAAYIKKV